MEDPWSKERVRMKLPVEEIDQRSYYEEQPRRGEANGSESEGARKERRELSVELDEYPRGGRMKRGLPRARVPQQQTAPQEGEWARHPCCGSLCVGTLNSRRCPTDRERFGIRPCW